MKLGQGREMLTLLNMFIVFVILILMVNAVAIYFLIRRFGALKRQTAHARGVAQEFCKLTGGSVRLLNRASRIWCMDVTLLEHALMSLPEDDKRALNGITAQRGQEQAEKIKAHNLKIERMTALHTDFLGQTPEEGIVIPEGARPYVG